MKILATLYPDRTVRIIAAVLLVLGVLLVLSHVAAGLLETTHPNPVTGTLRDFFGLEREGSVATWFSSFQLSLIAVVCGVILLCERACDSAAPYRAAWLGILCIFLFLSLDDTAQVHERLDKIMQGVWVSRGKGVDLPVASRSIILGGGGMAAAYTYLFLYGPALVAVVMFMRRFMGHRLEDRATRMTLLAGWIGFAVKLGLEPVESYIEDTTVWFGHHIMADIVIVQMYALILGETLILTALLNYLAAFVKDHPVRSNSLLILK